MARTKGALGKKTFEAAEKVAKVKSEPKMDVAKSAYPNNDTPVEKTFTMGGIVFMDISNEQYRTYVFADGRELTIYDPRGINISASRGHRIVTKDGWSVYVKPHEGWYLHWRSYPGNEPFIF